MAYHLTTFHVPQFENPWFKVIFHYIYIFWKWTIFICTIVFKKNGPLTNYKFQINNIAHARLLEAPVHKMTQWNHINMLYFEIKYVIEWNAGFTIAASMPLEIEITIKVIHTKFIETGYNIYRNKIHKKAK